MKLPKLFDKKLSKEKVLMLHLFINIFCLMWIIISCWTIDIATSAMNVNNVLDDYNIPSVFLTNGFWQREPIKSYHYGLWGVLLGSMIMMFSNVYLALTRIKEVKKDE